MLKDPDILDFLGLKARDQVRPGLASVKRRECTRVRLQHRRHLFAEEVDERPDLCVEKAPGRV
ncbi:hypothetical protein BLAT2472_130013 [Burkholderia latens]